jgi:SAM-dependent methyltransferase
MTGGPQEFPGNEHLPEVLKPFSANYGKVTWTKEVVVDFFLRHKPEKLLDCPAQNVWLCEQLVAEKVACVAADIVFPEESVTVSGGLLTVQHVDMNAPLPFPAEEFDAIVCLEGVEHCENPSLIIREFARCLKPGGAAFLSCPNVLNIKSRFKYFHRGSFYSFPHLISGEESPDGHRHLTPVTYPLIEYLAESNGLKVAELYYFGFARKYIPFLPLAAIVKGFVHVGALFVESPKRKALQLRLVSPPLLLGDQLLLRLEKPP